MDQPQLGYGKPTETSIDNVNIWMRGQPWYQEQMKAWGQDPGHPTLSKSQSSQILKMAQGQGVVVDQGDMEVDNHGNFNPKGHKLRNTLIVAGIAGATIATMGAAGVFSGGALGPSTAANMAATSAAANSVPAGISAAGLTTGVAGLAPLASTITAPGSAALPAGLSSFSSTPGLAGSTLASGGGIGSKIAQYGRDAFSSDNLVEQSSKALASGSQAAAHNRGTTAELMLDQNSDLEKQLIAREEEKRKAQASGYANLMTGNRTANWHPITGGDPYQDLNDEARAGGTELYNQGLARLTSPDLKTGQSGMPAYNNLNNNQQFQDALKPGKMENITGNASWILPLVSSIIRRR